jgi:radical SAM-linked protein
MSNYRYQIRFAKTGLLRWISHRDLARLWERTARRVGLRLALSEGFNPRARISFPSALALGLESLDEVVELELLDSLEPVDILRRLIDDQVEGLNIKDVCRLPENCGKSQLKCSHYVLELTAEQTWDQVEVQAKIDQLLGQGTIQFVRNEKTVTVGVLEQIASLAVQESQLQFALLSSRTASLRPQDVLAALGLTCLLEAGARLIRVKTVLDRDIDLAIDSGICSPVAHSEIATHLNIQYHDTLYQKNS